MFAASCTSADEETTYCDVLTAQVNELEEKYEQRLGSSGDPLTSLFVAAASSVEVLGDIAVLLERLAPLAPPEEELAHVRAAASLRSQIDAVAGAGSDPISAIFSAFVLGAADAGSSTAVDAYAQKTCGTQIFGTAPVTTEIVDGTVRPIAPEPEVDAIDLLEGTQLTATRWRIPLIDNVTCSETSTTATARVAEATDSLSLLDDVVVRLYWSDSVPNPQSIHQELEGPCGFDLQTSVPSASAPDSEVDARLYDNYFISIIEGSTITAMLLVRMAGDSDPDVERLATITEAISYNLEGLPLPVDLEVDEVEAGDAYERQDGIIELEPAITDRCGSVRTDAQNLRWVSPTRLLVACIAGDPTFHMYDTDSKRFVWSFDAVPPSDAPRFNFEFAFSSSLIAFSVSTLRKASGLDPEFRGVYVGVLDAQTGELLNGQELEEARVVAAGDNLVWIDSGSLVYGFDPISNETDSLGDEYYQSLQEWGQLIKLQRSGETDWLDVNSGQLVHVEVNSGDLPRTVCATAHRVFRPEAGEVGELDLSGGYRPHPLTGVVDDLRNAVRYQSGWLVTGAPGMRFIDGDLRTRWQLESGVEIKDLRIDFGRILIANAAWEYLELDMLTGEILNQYEERPQDWLWEDPEAQHAKANYRVVGTQLIPAPDGVCADRKGLPADIEGQETSGEGSSADLMEEVVIDSASARGALSGLSNELGLGDVVQRLGTPGPSQFAFCPSVDSLGVVGNYQFVFDDFDLVGVWSALDGASAADVYDAVASVVSGADSCAGESGPQVIPGSGELGSARADFLRVGGADDAVESRVVLDGNSIFVFVSVSGDLDALESALREYLSSPDLGAAGGP